MSGPTGGAGAADAARALGGEEPLRLLTQLVATAPTNLEDPVHQRWEKPNYLRTSDAIVRAARAAGLATRVYDPVVAGDVPGDWHGVPRPNVIADLDVGAKETILLLAHYDVVPIPTEQLGRWKSPPHTLTLRADGRLYGRGSSDDLGSGVVASLTALRHLAEEKGLSRNVRFIAACDEETGGEGGIEALKAHDARLASDDPGRFLRASIALIPDGSPEATGGSSGVAFLDGSFGGPVSLRDTLAYGDALVGLHELARTWRSVYLSPDWPARNAPEPVITGRATLTKFDFTSGRAATEPAALLAAHAESDAANQVPAAVTLVFGGSGPAVDRVVGSIERHIPPPFRIGVGGPTALDIPPGARAVQVIGQPTHGGYPHRGHNPVPVTLRVLGTAVEEGHLDGRRLGAATFTVDLRLVPEMELDAGLSAALERIRSWAAANSPLARIEAPPGRCRSGYALPPDHPAARKLDRILGEVFDVHGVVGEYGGTDASALRDLTTPAGEPLPALVFGSMDPAAHIHDAEESADPRLIAGVVRVIEQFVREP